MELSIISTTDIHAYLDKGLATLLNDNEKVATDLLIDNGDFLIGSPLSYLSYINGLANPMIDVANALGYDVMVPGNHDLDFGLSYLLDQVDRLSVDYVCANLQTQMGEQVFPPYIVKKIKGKKIAIIGLITWALNQLQQEDISKEVKVLNPMDILKNCLNELKGRADLICVCYHGGATFDPVNGQRWFYPSSEDQAGELIEGYPEIDSFIYGHQHFVNQFVNDGTGCIQAGCHGKYFGYQKWQFEQEKFTLVENKVDLLEQKVWPNQYKFYLDWLQEKFDEEALMKTIKKDLKADYYLLDFNFANNEIFCQQADSLFYLSYYQVPLNIVNKQPMNPSLNQTETCLVLANTGTFPNYMLRQTIQYNLIAKYILNG